MSSSSAATTWTLWVVGAVALQFVLSKTRSPAAIARSPRHHQQKQQQLTRFPRRSELHLQRKAQHLLTGLLFFFAAGALPIDRAVQVLLLAAVAFVALHFLRGAAPRVDALYLASFRGILRQEEADRRVLPGAFYFLLGAAVTATLFPLGVTRLALLHLAVGDPAASFCGTLYAQRTASSSKKPKPADDDKQSKTQQTRGLSENKSWAGFIGAFLATTLVSAGAMCFGDLRGNGVSYQPLSAALAAKALYSGFAAATAEAIDLGWDDNLTLPLLSGALLQLGAAVFGFEF